MIQLFQNIIKPRPRQKYYITTYIIYQQAKLTKYKISISNISIKKVEGLEKKLEVDEIIPEQDFSERKG